jgi:hypothetical protein
MLLGLYRMSAAFTARTDWKQPTTSLPSDDAGAANSFDHLVGAARKIPQVSKPDVEARNPISFAALNGLCRVGVGPVKRSRRKRK